MKTLSASFLTVLATCAVVIPVFAQGTAFTYQGRLYDGVNPANGTYDLTFGIWGVASGPPQVGGTLTNVASAVSNGAFAVTLYFGAGIFTGANRWLEIAVRTNGGGAFTTLTPRQAIKPTPYAIFTATAADVASGAVVKSLNTLKDNVTLAAGANVSITPSGNTLTIASAGGGGGWALNGANTYYNGGNVGIGTSAPAAKLHVQNGDFLAGAAGLEWMFHTRSSFSGDFLQITDSTGGVAQFQRRLRPAL